MDIFWRKSKIFWILKYCVRLFFLFFFFYKNLVWRPGQGIVFLNSKHKTYAHAWTYLQMFIANVYFEINKILELKWIFWLNAGRFESNERYLMKIKRSKRGEFVKFLKDKDERGFSILPSFHIVSSRKGLAFAPPSI